MKILAIPGSIRKQSSNKNLLKAISKLYTDRFQLDLYEELGELPHFNPDLDDKQTPAAVLAFRERIQASDGVIICSPEYVYSIPSSLKNAIEWCVSTTIFSGKPVAIIIAAASGEKALESLQLIMTTIEAKMAEGAKLLIRGGKGKVSIDGTITDEQTLEEVNALVEALLHCILDNT